MTLVTLGYNAIYKSRCHWSPEQIGELKTAFIKIKFYYVCFKEDKNSSKSFNSVVVCFKLLPKYYLEAKGNCVLTVLRSGK